jgi:hypothetical protein
MRTTGPGAGKEMAQRPEKPENNRLMQKMNNLCLII